MFRPKSTLEQWRIFQAVVEQGGYAQAAEKLNKSQSSLNHAIAKLQQTLGVALLEVRGRKAYLTDAGDMFLRRAKLLNQHMQELELLAHNIHQGWEAEIRLAVEIAHPRRPLNRPRRPPRPSPAAARTSNLPTTPAPAGVLPLGLRPRAAVSARPSASPPRPPWWPRSAAPRRGRRPPGASPECRPTTPSAARQTPPPPGRPRPQGPAPAPTPTPLPRRSTVMRSPLTDGE